MSNLPGIILGKGAIVRGILIGSRIQYVSSLCRPTASC